MRSTGSLFRRASGKRGRPKNVTSNGCPFINARLKMPMVLNHDQSLTHARASRNRFQGPGRDAVIADGDCIRSTRIEVDGWFFWVRSQSVLAFARRLSPSGSAESAVMLD